jgi:LPXTG-site transpeptidase (sortase) family protein
MSSLGSSVSEPGTAASGRGRTALYVLAVLVGVAFVTFALAGIAESRPRALALNTAHRAEPVAWKVSGVPWPTPVATATSEAPRPAAAASGPAEAEFAAGAEGEAAAAVAAAGPLPHPAKGVNFGTLTIPALQRALPIIEGTDAPQLKRGVGHYVRSAMPGSPNNCVLSGHRDTVFAGLGKVGVGDQLFVSTSAGVFTYQVREVRIVPKDDKTVIVPTDHAVLTVTTCYPFLYVGAAPDRFVLVADLVAGP